MPEAPQTAAALGEGSDTYAERVPSACTRPPAARLRHRVADRHRVA